MSEANTPTPERIFQIGLGFWASKALLSAIELGLFTELAKQQGMAEKITAPLGSLGGRCGRFG